MIGRGASRLREDAVLAAQRGDTAAATELFEQAAQLAPADSSILNSAANHFTRHGNRPRAIELLGQAVAANPGHDEPFLNLAVLLTSDRPADALALLDGRADRLSHTPRYWTVRAAAELALARKSDALASFEQAVTHDPANRRAQQGRARLQLETGRDSRAAYSALIQAPTPDGTDVLGYAQALEVAGDVEAAQAVGQQLVTQLPAWLDGLEWYAQLRWGMGDQAGFADHYQAAAEQTRDPAVHASWARMLAAVDRYREAADVLAAAQRTVGPSPHLALEQAVHLGAAGDDEAAGAIFAGLDLATPERMVHEARHWLRTADLGRAEALLADAIDRRPDMIAAWALRDVGWRLSGDARHQWLHGQPGLIAPLELSVDDDQWAAVTAFLDRLHDRSTMPLGQSVRGGSQTRGGLFDRHEPEVKAIEAAFRVALEAYRAGLPPADPTHPLLRHRDRPWVIAGSWSIRAYRGGRHAEHIHPKGLVSSAGYVVVPDHDGDDDATAGFLELGRPPPDLRVPLEPIAAIEPRPRTCALFPSTLFHGTRPFRAGKRMTVAIDIQAGADA